MFSPSIASSFPSYAPTPSPQPQLSEQVDEAIVKPKVNTTAPPQALAEEDSPILSALSPSKTAVVNLPQTSVLKPSLKSETPITVDINAGRSVTDPGPATASTSQSNIFKPSLTSPAAQLAPQPQPQPQAQDEVQDKSGRTTPRKGFFGKAR
jgi:hypothetical protein